MSHVIVIGGGLAGLSAAHTVLERGGNVVVLDKEKFLGGNSTKATSGINGAGTNTQAHLGIPDTKQAFIADTTKSARELGRPEMIEVLCGESADAVHWLERAFGLDLSLTGRLGGHSFPRTHRGKERFPGMTITYALMEKLEEMCERFPHRATYLNQAHATELIVDNGQVTGVVYTRQGVVHRVHGPVVIATGGYGADFSEGSLLAKHRPDVLRLPTTNGPHCTGDGIKMSVAIGAGLADIEQVQVHPTGLIDPTDPDSKVKWLAAEALRGAGGLLLDANGKRFCNELGHRDYVTGEMGKNKGPFSLVLNHVAAESIIWHCKHYVGRGLMQHVASGAELAKLMGVAPSTLAATFDKYNQVAQQKSCPFGKLFFAGLPFSMNDSFYIGTVTPVVHYTMGGLDVGPDTAVKTTAGAPIDGLFAAGEVMGGVHGVNRLGGSSLLDCVVFGRVAGLSATSCLTQRILKSGGGGATSAASGNTRIQISPENGSVSIDVSWGGSSAPSASSTSSLSAKSSPKAPASTTAPAPAAAPAATPPAQPAFRTDITPAEVAKHNTKDDCWVIINGEVVDVTTFLNDHPGGAKAILLYAGKDCTEEFNMLHKPTVLRKYAEDLIIGKLAKANL